jgi:spermidine/putrescine transport system substrate-binding protein
MPENAVRNMYYIGYTSVISGGDDDTVFQYVDWCYGADEDEDNEEELIEYPVGFFFTGDDENEDYIITTTADQSKRQLAAQYPSQEVLERSAIMQYFDDAASKEINQMWINVRCFNVKDISVSTWLIVAAILLLVIGVIQKIRSGRYRE